MQSMNKLRWGELDEEDGEDLDFLLPPKQVIGPDGNGMKKVIEYKFNDEGNKVKITTTSKVRKLAKAHLSKSAVARRSWPKFGDAVKEDVGACLTVVSTEEVVLERPKAPGSNTMEAKSSTDPFGANKGAVLMICRTCGKKGDHWTSRCPYKDLSTPTDTFVDKPAESATAGSKGAYVAPPHRGGERPATDMRRRNDENAVRVTNLSEDTREADLHELFRPFGSVTRVFVPIDHSTGLCRGFAYVNFAMKEDAERAIKKLNGYGYDSLILSVEWSAPRTN
ncbi:eukaryotic translation initiation factor 3 subunit G-like [Phyllobates terribilis]|uniref:eukaryotic translation initiation factor 3 subunit G-like n=1 Tax=Phyllobates terribilis TaxID=111132 RepID=UPI003CCB1179